MLQLANLASPDAESLAWEDLDLAEVLKWCIGQVHQIAEEHRVTIAHDLESATVAGVEDHLKMLFSNLIANAVVYSHEGDEVRVTCRQNTETGPSVLIRDTGIGIPADKVTHIFEEYYRTEEAVKHNRQSTGLGLAIVRQVAERHWIRIEVQSELDVGTAFVLTFPLSCAVNGA
jgi:signal transduction histidine kinase